MSDAAHNPYAPPSQPTAASPVVPAPPYAGLLRRLGHLVVDELVFLPIVIPLFWLGTRRWHIGWINLPLAAAQIAYVVALTSSGATWGMRAVRVRVVDRAGRPPGLRRACLRSSITILVVLLSVTPWLCYGAWAIAHPAQDQPWPRAGAALYRASLRASRAATWVNLALVGISAVMIWWRRDKRGLSDLVASTWCVVVPRPPR